MCVILTDDLETPKQLRSVLHSWNIANKLYRNNSALDDEPERLSLSLPLKSEGLPPQEFAFLLRRTSGTALSR